MEVYQLCVWLSFGISSVQANKFLPNIVYKKLQDVIKSKWPNSRPWMPYLEKHLQILFYPPTIELVLLPYVSILQKAPKRKQLMSKYLKCHNKSEDLQLGIYGKICGSYKNGQEFHIPNKKCHLKKNFFNRELCRINDKSMLTLNYFVITLKYAMY